MPLLIPEFGPGAVWIHAGPSRSYKTLLAFHQTRTALDEGWGVLYHSNENPTDFVYAAVDPQGEHTNRFRVVTHSSDTPVNPLLEGGPQLLVFDSLDLRGQMLTEIRALCSEYRRAALVVAQLGRHRPVEPSAVRIADYVTQAVLDEHARQRGPFIECVKNRNGRTFHRRAFEDFAAVRQQFGHLRPPPPPEPEPPRIRTKTRYHYILEDDCF